MSNISARIIVDGETVDQYEASIDPTKVNIDVEVERSQSFVENRELLYLEKKRIKELLSKIEDLRQWGNTKLTELVNNNNNNEQNDTSMQIDEENSDEDGESGDQNIILEDPLPVVESSRKRLKK